MDVYDRITNSKLIMIIIQFIKKRVAPFSLTINAREIVKFSYLDSSELKDINVLTTFSF